MERHHLNVTFERDGIRETYLHSNVDTLSLELWIYENEAELCHQGRQVLCERESFATEEALAEAFLGEIARILEAARGPAS